MTKKYNYLLDEDMKLFEEKGRVVAYTAGDVILSENRENQKIFWLRKGSVRVELERLFPGITLAKIGAGEMFGEISFLSDDRASASVTADEDTEVLEVDRAVMTSLLSANDALAARFYRTTSATLIERLRV